ncbi:MAG: DUF1990 domain-containing protein [Blastocatellia bacterium]
MFCLTKPSRSAISAFSEANKGADFSYPFIGETEHGFVRSRKHKNLKTYNIDHNRIIIGQGNEDWEKAKNAVRNWKMFDMRWVELCWPDTPIEEDRTVAILVRHFGFYSLNAARIVYVIDKWDRFGFAYGTLADHGESGEERFMVEMDEETGEVWYDLYAFSKPNHFLAKLGYPLTRMLQKQFAADSKTAMLRAI